MTTIIQQDDKSAIMRTGTAAQRANVNIGIFDNNEAAPADQDGRITGDILDQSRIVIDIVRNNTGGSLSAGLVVAITGYDAVNGYPEVGLADGPAGVFAAAMLVDTLADQTQGRAMFLGSFSGVNTSSASANDPIYSGANGTILFDAPTTGNVQQIGRVLSVDVANGSVWFNSGSDPRATETILNNFQATTSYAQYSMITNNGIIYRAKTTFTSGATFDADDWEVIADQAGALLVVVTNNSGATINAGTLVTAKGWSANNDPNITIADAPSRARASGIALSTALDGEQTLMLAVGLTTADTTGTSIDDEIYLGSNGALVFGRPTLADGGIQRVGRVLSVGLTGNIAISPDPMEEVFDVDIVKHFGAPVDGTTDCATAIQAAITYCFNNEIGQLNFPPIATNNTYTLNSSLTLPNDNGSNVPRFVLEGNGSTLRLTNGTAVAIDRPISDVSDAIVETTWVPVIRNFGILGDAGPNSGNAIRLHKFRGVEISNVTMTNMNKGIELTWCEQAKVSRCNAIDVIAPYAVTGGEGRIASGTSANSNSHQTTLEHCRAEPNNAGSTGFYLETSGNVTVDRCLVVGNAVTNAFHVSGKAAVGSTYEDQSNVALNDCWVQMDSTANPAFTVFKVEARGSHVDINAPILKTIPQDTVLIDATNSQQSTIALRNMKGWMDTEQVNSTVPWFTPDIDASAGNRNGWVLENNNALSTSKLTDASRWNGGALPDLRALSFLEDLGVYEAVPDPVGDMYAEYLTASGVFDIDASKATTILVSLSGSATPTITLPTNVAEITLFIETNGFTFDPASLPLLPPAVFPVLFDDRRNVVKLYSDALGNIIQVSSANSSP